ncbi:MAG TPA: hypothetical protein VKE93_05625, partial [Candidatus Angelobacter sp.]|nr:hypothetical protein [Candidatus Angelobacter sp.]
QAPGAIAYKARIDCNGFSVWPCRGSFSLETFKLGITVHQYGPSAQQSGDWDDQTFNSCEYCQR